MLQQGCVQERYLGPSNGRRAHTASTLSEHYYVNIQRANTASTDIEYYEEVGQTSTVREEQRMSSLSARQDSVRHYMPLSDYTTENAQYSNLQGLPGTTRPSVSTVSRQYNLQTRGQAPESNPGCPGRDDMDRTETRKVSKRLRCLWVLSAIVITCLIWAALIGILIAKSPPRFKVTGFSTSSKNASPTTTVTDESHTETSMSTPNSGNTSTQVPETTAMPKTTNIYNQTSNTLPL